METSTNVPLTSRTRWRYSVHRLALALFWLSTMPAGIMVIAFVAANTIHADAWKLNVALAWLAGILAGCIAAPIALLALLAGVCARQRWPQIMATGLILAVTVAGGPAVVMHEKMERRANLRVALRSPEAELIRATQRGDYSRAEELVQQGANPVAYVPTLSSAIDVAAELGRERFVVLFCQARGLTGAYLDSALTISIEQGNLGLVQRLLEFGANVDAGRHGNAGHSLVVAANNGDTEMVALLLEHGIKLEQPNAYRTALWSAAYHNHEIIVRMLLEAGADPNAGQEFPIDAALRRDPNSPIVALLREYGALETAAPQSPPPGP